MNNKKIKAARLSVLSNTFLVISKIAIAVAIGSVSILAEGIHSSMDLVAAIIAFYAVRISSQPADENHNYGHGKFENVSGTVEALLIFIAAGMIIVEAVGKLFHPEKIDHLEYGIAIMVVSSVINFFISQHLMKVGKEFDSVALQADALHLRTDVYTSLGVMAGLIAVYMTGISWLDPLFAIGVALILIYTSWEMTKEAFFPLLDSSLSKDKEDQIILHIQNHNDKYVDFKNLRTRKAGSKEYIDFYLTFHHHITIVEAHEYTDIIELEIRKSFPEADIIIHQEPCELKETIEIKN